MRNLTATILVLLAALMAKGQQHCNWDCHSVNAIKWESETPSSVILLDKAYDVCATTDGCIMHFTCSMRINVVGDVDCIYIDLSSFGLTDAFTYGPHGVGTVPFHNMTTSKDDHMLWQRVPNTSKVRIFAGRYRTIPNGMLSIEFSGFIKQ